MYCAYVRNGMVSPGAERSAVVLLVAFLLASVVAGVALGSDNRNPLREQYNNRSENSFYGATKTPGGNLLVGTTGDIGRGTRYDAWVVSINESGGVVWERRFNTTDAAVIKDVVRTDSGYVVAGKTEARSVISNGQRWIAKLSDDGSVRWSETYGQGSVYALSSSSTEGVVAVGEDGSHDPNVINVGEDGSVVWERTFDGGYEFNDVLQTENGYLFVGKGLRDYSEKVGLAVSVDESGDVQWRREYDSVKRLTSAGRSSDGDYLFGAPGPKIFGVDRNGTVSYRTALSGPGAVRAIRSNPANGTVVGTGTDLTDGRAGSSGQGRIFRLDDRGEIRRSWSVGATHDLLAVDDGIALAIGRTERRYSSDTNGFAYSIDHESPSARLAVSPGRAETGVTTVELSADRSTDNTRIDQYRWDFDGDGRVDRNTTEPNVSYIYDIVGPVDTTVTVVDADGNRNTASVEVSLTDTTLPTPSLSIPNPKSVATSAPARLNASASTDNHRIVEYRWDFDGDGRPETVSDDPATRHRFSESGLHRIALTVVDASGHENTSTFALQTAENGPPNVSVDVGLAVDGDRTHLTANATDRVGTPTVTWTFPNGTRKTGERVSYVFNGSGERTVKVVVEDEYGASKTKRVTVDVRDSYPSDVAGIGFVIVFVLYGGALVIVSACLGAGAWWLWQRR